MERKLIQVLFWLLLIQSIFYWLGKFHILFEFWYQGYKAHWGLFMLFQFLGVASVVIDLIVRFDRMKHPVKSLYAAVVAALAISYAAQILFGIMELYMRGTI